jgi:hypothetical protein
MVVIEDVKDRVNLTLRPEEVVVAIGVMGLKFSSVIADFNN